MFLAFRINSSASWGFTALEPWARAQATFIFSFSSGSGRLS